MTDEKYISLDDVCEILNKHGAYTSEIAEKINNKAISAVDTGYLEDWYIASVPESDKPVWTEGHIEEMARDFALLPREDDYFGGNGYAKRFAPTEIKSKQYEKQVREIVKNRWLYISSELTPLKDMLDKAIEHKRDHDEKHGRETDVLLIELLESEVDTIISALIYQIKGMGKDTLRIEEGQTHR